MSKEALENALKSICDFYDPDELVSLLGLTTADLVVAFEELIIEKLHKFEEAM